MTTLAPFEIHRATTVAEACQLVGELGDEAAVYSGGTELLLLMKLGFASFAHLVDVKPIAELGRLEVGGDGRLVVGGAVTHRSIERSSLVQEGWPDLVAMERRVANVRVRSTGSLGGNLAFADPHSDPATFLLAADASVQLGQDGRRRELPVDEFVLGPYETALDPGELLCAVLVPPPGPGTAVTHLRFAVQERPAATVSASVRVEGGRVAAARVAVGSVGIMPVLVPDASEALAGAEPGAIDRAVLTALGEAGAAAAEPVSDANGSDDYKAALVRVLVGRAVVDAAARAAAA